MLMKYSWRISSYCLLQSCKMQVSHFLSLSLDAASSEMGFGGDILLRFSLMLLRCTISWSFLLISRPLTFGRSIAALQLFWQPFLCLIANGMQFFLAVFLFFSVQKISRCNALYLGPCAFCVTISEWRMDLKWFFSKTLMHPSRQMIWLWPLANELYVAFF